MTQCKGIKAVASDILLHNILPHLTIPELWNLIQALPELEPIVDVYQPWGEHYARTKQLPERKMSFREFYPKFQGIYLWGFVQKDTSMAKWIASRPTGELSESRGPLVFSMKDRRGIFRSEYGFGLLKPLRLDIDVELYVSQIALGCYLVSNGYLFVRVPGGAIEPLPRVRNCKVGSLSQSQWGVLLEQTNGTHWMVLPVSDCNDKRMNVFRFPFPNRPRSCCQNVNGLWTVVQGMGIVQFPRTYNGGDDYEVLFADLPEDCESMATFYRRVIVTNNVNAGDEEVVPEYRHCAVLLGASGALYFCGPERYFDETNGKIVHPNDWQPMPKKGWDTRLVARRLKTVLGPDMAEAPHLTMINGWGYRYGIGVDERDASVLYFDVNDATNGPFVATSIINGMGVCGLGRDGRVYALDFLTNQWQCIRGIERAKKMFSTLIHCRGELIEMTTIQVLTEDGELFQLGYTQGQAVINQGQTREVPAHSQRLDPLRIGHYITAPGVSPRRRVFNNPFSAIPAQCKLPGFVEDVGHVYSESILYVALLKEWQLDQ